MPEVKLIYDQAEVDALIAEAVAKERERCADLRDKEVGYLREVIADISPWLAASLSELSEGHDGAYEKAVNAVLIADSSYATPPAQQEGKE